MRLRVTRENRMRSALAVLAALPWLCDAQTPVTATFSGLRNVASQNVTTCGTFAPSPNWVNTGNGVSLTTSIGPCGSQNNVGGSIQIKVVLSTTTVTATSKDPA